MGEIGLRVGRFWFALYRDRREIVWKLAWRSALALALVHGYRYLIAL